MMMNWMILRSKRHSLQKAIGKIFSTDQSAKLVHNTNFFLNLNSHCKCRNASINSSYAHPQPQGNAGHVHTLSAREGGGGGVRHLPTLGTPLSFYHTGSSNPKSKHS